LTKVPDPKAPGVKDTEALELPGVAWTLVGEEGGVTMLL